MLRKDTKELYGFLVSSKIRTAILKSLYENPSLSQMDMSRKLKQKQQNIYKAVHDLEKAGLIECLNSNKKAWKHYMITELGKEIIAFGEKLKEEAKIRCD
jgi:DNA-binding MarR family transcriptional regulator